MADLIVTVKQVKDTPTSAGTARQHKVVIDRPKEKGGLDEGAMGGELLLLALGGCFMSNLIAAAKARDVQIDDLSVDVHGALAAAPPRFESIALEVHGQSPDAATFDKLIQIAEHGCIVHNTLAGGVRVEVKRM
jgi:putative redox protein